MIMFHWMTSLRRYWPSRRHFSDIVSHSTVLNAGEFLYFTCCQQIRWEQNQWCVSVPLFTFRLSPPQTILFQTTTPILKKTNKKILMLGKLETAVHCSFLQTRVSHESFGYYFQQRMNTHLLFLWANTPAGWCVCVTSSTRI